MIDTRKDGVKLIGIHDSAMTARIKWILMAALAILLFTPGGAKLVWGQEVQVAHVNGHDTGGGMSARMSLERSAEAGDPFAAFVAGRKHLIAAANSGDMEQRQIGLEFINMAADAGFAPAARFAGSLYLAGELLPQDTEQAIFWFTRAAKLGDASAQRDLGDLYAEGDRIKQDLAKAALWYEATLANPQADYIGSKLYEVSYQLGEMYAEGVGVEAKPNRARELWQQAAEQAGYPPAIQRLARAQAEGLGGKEDRKAAMDNYLAAAEAYREAGLKFNIGPTTARREVNMILSDMRRLEARKKLVRRVEKEMEGIIVP